MDLSTLTDDDLDEQRRAILTEQERRAALATIPAQVAELARVYRDGGGDPADLVDALTD